MKLLRNQISYIGGILFFIGLILILISWYFTYPIEMPELNEITFTQFYPTIWPGMILSIIGLFLAGYYSRRKSIRICCVAAFPILLFSHIYFFSYISTSDSAGVKAMFEVFHNTGINISVEPYFQFPVYFTLNDITGQTLNLNVTGIALIFFAFFGILIAIYLYFYLKSISENNSYQIAFLAIFLYFTGLYFYLNYQWVPQTIAFIFFILLLIVINKNTFEYQLLSIIIFTALTFTHLFIPAIFLVFLGFYCIKRKEYRNSLLLMICIYFAVLIYHATFYSPFVFKTFFESIYNLGGEYAVTISQSFKEPVGLISQILSALNRVRVPLIWIIVSFGFLILVIKRKMSYTAIALGLAGGIYLIIGFFYSVLGTRSLQILFIPLVVGIGFYYSKWKKLTIILVIIFLVLSLSGPMRDAHDTYLFQMEEEEHACDFLANTIKPEEPTRLAIGGINSGYFSLKFNYVNINNDKKINLFTIVPSNPEFSKYYNTSIQNRTFVLYNPNLGKEMISYGMTMSEVEAWQQSLERYNKVYSSKKTFVAVGR